MLPAIFQLIAILIIAAVCYWALNKLWPFTKEFGSSFIGQLIYVLLIIAGVVAIVFYGVLPLLYAFGGALGGGSSRSFPGLQR
jgi:hypothetical protein